MMLQKKNKKKIVAELQNRNLLNYLMFNSLNQGHVEIVDL